MPSRCILSISSDPQLMVTRTLLLRRAGYAVDEAYEKAAALSRAQCDSVDALLICHSVPKAERRWLIARVREKRKLMPILCLTVGMDHLPDDSCTGVPSDPEELLNALAQALEISSDSGHLLKKSVDKVTILPMQKER
jgi:DNA-binding response OmpR family regulator